MTAPAASLVGLEHEYQLRRDGQAVDFRDLIHGLAVPGRRLDPGDTNAYRCPSGMALTCDDAEAEVASPPLALAPGFTAQVDAWAHAGRRLLGDLLPADIALHGFSSHLSVAVPDRDADRVLAVLAGSFGPALMMVLDRAGSHGIYLRPRPSRMELCGEYAIGARLQAAAALFAGAVRAAAGGGPVPPALAITPHPAGGRVGLELDRHLAFGFDLYREGRAATLPAGGGGTVDGQRHLELSWACARAALTRTAGPEDLEAMDRIVAGASPLGIEAAEDDVGLAGTGIASTPFGDLLVPRHRGDVEVAPFLATWGFTVFRVRGAGRSRYACIPRASLAAFLDRLDAGVLDGWLAAAPSSGRILASAGQTGRPGLWDAVGDPTDLLPPERTPSPPATSRGARHGKPLVPPASPPAAALPEPVRQPRGPVALLIAVVLTILLVGAAFASGLFGGGGEEAVPTVVEAPVASTTTAPVTTTTSTTLATTTSAPAVTVPQPAPTVVAPATTAPTVVAPATTAPAPTTTLAPATTTTTAVPAPVTLTVGPGCTFSPASSTRPVGSAVRVANQSGGEIGVTVTGPPGSSGARFSLDAGGTSAAYVLDPAGDYAFRCVAGGAAGQAVLRAT